MNNDRYTSASRQSKSVASGDQAMQDMSNMTELEKKAAARRRDQERTQSAKKQKPSKRRLFGLIPAKRKKRRWVYAFFAALSLEIQQAKDKSAEKKAQRTKADAASDVERYQTQQSKETSRRTAKKEKRQQKLAAVQADGNYPAKAPILPEVPMVEEEEFLTSPNSVQLEEDEREFQILLNAMLAEEGETESQIFPNPEQPAAEEDEFQNLLNALLAEEEEPQSSLSPEQSAAEEDEFQNLLNALLAEDGEEESQPSSNPEQSAEEETESQFLPAVMLVAEEEEPQTSPSLEQPAAEETIPQISSNPESPVAEEMPSQQTDEILQTSTESVSFENENATVTAEQSKRKLDKKTWITAVLIFCSIMLATLIFLGIRSATAANDFRKLSQQISEKEAELSASLPAEETPVATGPAANDEAGIENDPEETEPVVKTILPKYADLAAQNPELFGWVRIDDTVLDYPVMRSAMDNEKYLYANFEGKYSFAGTPFVDNQCTSDSDNLVIYGHNIKDGSMFRSLFKYEKESYWKKHPTIMYSDLCEDYEYEVMAVFYDRIYKKTEDVFKFYQFIDADSEEDFNYAVEQLKSKSLYDTGVDAQYGDQLITLVTCSYQVENGRFVVVARRK